jgi:hypothetical protein
MKQTLEKYEGKQKNNSSRGLFFCFPVLVIPGSITLEQCTGVKSYFSDEN